MRIKCFAMVALALAPTVATADETATYNYDSEGRLRQVAKAGFNGSSITSFTFDGADNRTAVSTTGSVPNGPPQSAVVVVPLAGLKVIALPMIPPG